MGRNAASQLTSVWLPRARFAVQVEPRLVPRAGQQIEQLFQKRGGGFDRRSAQCSPPLGIAVSDMHCDDHRLAPSSSSSASSSSAAAATAAKIAKLRLPVVMSNEPGGLEHPRPPARVLRLEHSCGHGSSALANRVACTDDTLGSMRHGAAARGAGAPRPHPTGNVEPVAAHPTPPIWVGIEGTSHGLASLDVAVGAKTVAVMDPRATARCVDEHRRALHVERRRRADWRGEPHGRRHVDEVQGAADLGAEAVGASTGEGHGGVRGAAQIGAAARRERLAGLSLRRPRRANAEHWGFRPPMCSKHVIELERLQVALTVAAGDDATAASASD